jgi:hypothetical protein
MVSRVHDSGSSQDRDLKSFAGSRLQIFTSSRLPSFAGSRLQIFASSQLPSFAGSRFQIFASSRLRGFAGSRFLKTHFTNFITPDVSRVTGFPQSPTLAPRGSGLTPTIRFHENLRISVKNVTLETSEWTRVIRKSRNGRIKAGS